jgi:hypothetical protein
MNYYDGEELFEISQRLGFIPQEWSFHDFMENIDWEQENLLATKIEEYYIRNGFDCAHNWLIDCIYSNCSRLEFHSESLTAKDYIQLCKTLDKHNLWESKYPISIKRRWLTRRFLSSNNRAKIMVNLKHELKEGYKQMQLKLNRIYPIRHKVNEDFDLLMFIP